MHRRRGAGQSPVGHGPDPVYAARAGATMMFELLRVLADAVARRKG